MSYAFIDDEYYGISTKLSKKQMFGFWCTLLISVLLRLSYFFKLLYMRSNVCYYNMFPLKVVIDISTH